MLIDVSFFISGPRHIQNALIVEMPDHVSLVVKEVIEGYIRAFQPEFLHSAVGPELSSAISDYLEIIEQEKGETTEESVEEPVSGYALLCDKLRESFADYVFFHILRDINTETTITGLVRLKCVDEYVSPIRRQVTTWNSMVGKNRRFIEWVQTDECPYKVRIDRSFLTNINTFNL